MARMQIALLQGARAHTRQSPGAATSHHASESTNFFVFDVDVGFVIALSNREQLGRHVLPADLRQPRLLRQGAQARATRTSRHNGRLQCLRPCAGAAMQDAGARAGCRGGLFME